VDNVSQLAGQTSKPSFQVGGRFTFARAIANIRLIKNASRRFKAEKMEVNNAPQKSFEKKGESREKKETAHRKTAPSW
jgi:hypothetical protein